MEQFGAYYAVMCPSDVDEMATSVDSDQTAPLGSGFALFSWTYLSHMR